MRAVGGAGTLAVLVGASVLIAAGCANEVVDSAGTEALVEEDLTEAGRKVASVECPSEVEVVKGETFECTVTFADGEREVATLKIRNEDADLALTDLQPSN
jgi:hypothetical protein